MKPLDLTGSPGREAADAVVYIHGKGGSAGEAARYRPLFPGCEVVGLDYRAFTPWEAGDELREAIEGLKRDHASLTLIANSIGAYFAMNAGIEGLIRKVFFISPIVDMEGLIVDSMERAQVTEAELKARGTVRGASGEELSWDYLRYVREHPLRWSVPTEILYGSRDALTSPDTIAAFAKKHGAKLTVMEGGEHWFHTEAQLRFLDAWLRNARFAAAEKEQSVNGIRFMPTTYKGENDHVENRASDEDLR